MKNLICVGQKEDDHGNVTSILVEAEFAQKYREKQRERNKRYYEKKKAEAAEVRRAAGIPDPQPKPKQTKEEKIRKQVAHQKEYYRGKISPYSTITVKNTSARDRLDAAQEKIIQALPEEKRSLIDASQDAYMELVMDEGEAAFAEGVKFGIRLMMEILVTDGEARENAGNS